MVDGIKIHCTGCGAPYPDGEVVFRCPRCDGLFDIQDPFPLDLQKVDPSQPGMWQYRHAFGLPEGAEAVSLGEGATPLVQAEVDGRPVYYKCEYLNPTGSFKDRGSSLIATWLRSRGVTQAVEDSSGNAGASFAAYAARAGIQARIFVPASASGPKRNQIEVYGAELVPIAGSREDVTEAVLQAVTGTTAYASHAYLPFNLPGYATAAYEIYEQLGQMPSAVIVPVGQGGFLLGLARGFDALRIAIKGSTIPQMIGVQARACAPMWAQFNHKSSVQTDQPTLAEGVRTRFPLRLNAVVAAVEASDGSFVAVDEADILPARDELAHLGLYVEPTSALAGAALHQILPQLPDPVVVVLTGFGLKYGVK